MIVLQLTKTIKMILLFLGILLAYAMDKSSAEIYVVKFDSTFYRKEFSDAPANFGPSLSDETVRGMLTNVTPADGCDKMSPPPVYPINQLGWWIALVPRYTMEKNCTFEDKVRNAQQAGYRALIIYNVGSNELVPMTAANKTGIQIPSVFVSENSGLYLLDNIVDPDYFIVLTAENPYNIQTHLLIPFAVVVGLCFIVMIVFMIVKFIKDRRRQRRHRLPKSTLNKIPIKKFQKGDPYDTCAICLDDYVEGEKLRVLPCNHVYHSKCIDPWLTKNKRVCPICKRKVFAHDEEHRRDYSDSDSDTDDTTPLIGPSNRGTQGGTFEPVLENPLQRAMLSVSQQSGVGAANLVTASDYHSINGDCISIDSSTTDSVFNSLGSDGASSRGPHHVCDNLEVHVHQPDTRSESSRSDIPV